MLILSGSDIDRLLLGRERDLVETVKRAYESHARKNTSLPHSVFLRFPSDTKSRMIALPAYLGEDFQAAGIKWVASFPRNLDAGLERASAVLIMNSTETGRPEAIIEASIINAKRTAASAALALMFLAPRKRLDCLAIVGAGLINYETLLFIKAMIPAIEKLIIHDLNPDRAAQFKRMCEGLVDDIEVAERVDNALSQARVVSFATTSGSPYITRPEDFLPGSVVLHISLRDLSPEVILAGTNIVDDPDHVCRESTSIHLTEQEVGNRDFISCTIGEILIGAAGPATDGKRITIFSPFGLGILDVAVGQYVYRLASRLRVGTSIDSFSPPHWTERSSLKSRFTKDA